jgi:hypothetical protein
VLQTSHFEGRVLCVFDGLDNTRKQDELFEAACRLKDECNAPECAPPLVCSKAVRLLCSGQTPARFEPVVRRCMVVEKAEFLSRSSYKALEKKDAWKSMGAEAFHERVTWQTVKVADERRRIKVAAESESKAHEVCRAPSAAARHFSVHTHVSVRVCTTGRRLHSKR